MPKMKTHKGYSQAFPPHRHRQDHARQGFQEPHPDQKSQKRIRGFRKETELAKADVKVVSSRMGKVAHSRLSVLFFTRS